MSCTPETTGVMFIHTLGPLVFRLVPWDYWCLHTPGLLVSCLIHLQEFLVVLMLVTKSARTVLFKVSSDYFV